MFDSCLITFSTSLLVSAVLSFYTNLISMSIICSIFLYGRTAVLYTNLTDLKKKGFIVISDIFCVLF